MTERPPSSLIGTRFGSYRITGLIGAGGMGEVYRATDERLGRDVAVKVLGEISQTDRDWRERVEREARLLASINHPHIGAIYGVEEINGTPALILELIEGPTLAAKGIVHRDLKPANIVITGHARIDLEEDGTTNEAGASTVDGGAPRDKRSTAMYAALVVGIAALIVAAAVGAAFLSSPAPRTANLTRFTIESSPQVSVVEGAGVAISRDGRLVVYVGASERVRRLYLRRIDEVAAREMSGTEGGAQPFFSPDNQWVGFFSSGKLRKVPINGGSSEVIADAPSPRGGAWGPDNTIVYAPTPDGALAQVSASGGTVTPATSLGEREGSHRYPIVLPDGRSIVYAAGPSDTVSLWSEAAIVAENLRTHARAIIAPRGTSPRFLSPNLIVFVQTTQLFVVPIDMVQLQTMGAASAIDEHVMQAGSGHAQYDLTPDGTLVSIPSSYVPSGMLALADREGVQQRPPVHLTVTLNWRAPLVDPAAR